MKYYRATVTGDRYPVDFTVQATNWAAAAARAVREWKKRFKGSRTETLTIRITKN